METPKTEWELVDAIDYARYAEQVGKPLGLHIALGGGVLHNGWSDKDIDLVVVKHGNEHTSRSDLERLALALKWDVWDVREYGPERSTAICLDESGRRIDLIAV